MNMFLRNLLLAIVWALATGQVSVPNILIGFVLGYVVLLLAQQPGERHPYFGRFVRVIRFSFFYLGQLLKSNLRVAYDVATPKYYMRPGVIAVPLDVQTESEITLLANLITLTPGTLSLDLSADRRTLYVHVMYIDVDPDQARREIKDGLERRVLELTR
jgi:multicomponent Na+:H+ antiporter subunit E